jgi:hypothetical protein
VNLRATMQRITHAQQNALPCRPLPCSHVPPGVAETNRDVCRGAQDGDVVRLATALLLRGWLAGESGSQGAPWAWAKAWVSHWTDRVQGRQPGGAGELAW